MRERMSYRAPTAADIRSLAALEHIELDDGEAEELLPVIAGLVAAANITDSLDGSELGLPKAVRQVESYRPTRDEDPFNVFIRKFRIGGEPHGRLAGKTVGVKDNISVAGVETTNGSRFTPYVPSMDAAVVERILGAGGTIVGKLNMDDFGAAGTGETSVFGAPRNPVNPLYSAGGSSGGSGAAVRAGEVDLALAVDQGGSSRIPAAFCGVVTAKGTHGLVPSFGITHIDHTLDCIAPIGRTVRDTADMLEVIAGPDWRDPQWIRGEFRAGAYAQAEAEGVAGLSIGIVEESCSDQCANAVLAGLDRAAGALEEAGAKTSRISIPVWAQAFTIFQPYIACLIADMFRSDNVGYGHLGLIDAGVVRSIGRSRVTESLRIAKQLKCWLMCERYLHDTYTNEPYARLQNLRLLVRREISGALTKCDLLMTPTIPVTAPQLLDGDQSFATISSRTSASLPYNTSPLNLSGHPALSVPSGADEEGLPTAVQLVAAHFDEFAAFRAAFELERAMGPFASDPPGLPADPPVDVGRATGH
jgi:amidase